MVDVREAVTLFLPLVVSVILFFFFSSRRRHTRLTCDWSSDVCSSDLAVLLDAAVEGAVDRTALARRGRRGGRCGPPRRGRGRTRRGGRGTGDRRTGGRRGRGGSRGGGREIGRASWRERGESGGGVVG